MSSIPEIIGHERERSQLTEDIAKGKVSHSYLFSGKKHLGKFTIAKWFATELFTHGKNETEKREIMHLIDRNMHPDLLTLDQLWIEDICTDWNIIARSSNISQEKRAKRKVKTDTIGIDDVRELQYRLHETSQTGRTCCLIRSIERLNLEAANALLKILEEPPPSVTFCCTTESLSSLPQTIVSRMRIVNFSPVRSADLKPLLARFAEDDRPFLLGIAQGCPGIIIRCKEDVSRLRTYRQDHIAAHSFLEAHSLLSRLQQMTTALEKKTSSDVLQHLFLHLQQNMRSEDERKVKEALRTAKELLKLMHTLESNTHRHLLATHTAFQCS
jgi:DNA polymerase III delta prime subunit